MVSVDHCMGLHAPSSPSSQANMIPLKDEGGVVAGLYLESTLCGGGSENDVNARKASLASISDMSSESEDGSLPCFHANEVVESEDCDGRVVNDEPSSSENKKDVLWKKLGMLFRPRQISAVVVDTDSKAEVTQEEQSDAPLMTEKIEDVTSKRRGTMWRKIGINLLLRPRPEEQQSQNADDDDCTVISSTTSCTAETPALPEVETHNNEQTNSDISEELKVRKGGDVLVSHIGRDAVVNAAALVTSILSGDTSAIIGAYIAGGAVTSKRLVDGIISRDEKEVTKSLAVLGCATGASIGGQALTCAVLLGVAGASLPVAGVVAFGVGCCSGGAAGALSEWTVDKLYIGKKKEKNTTCSSDSSASSSSSSENWKSTDIAKQTKQEQQQLIEQTNHNDTNRRRQQSYHYYHHHLRPITQSSPRDGGFMLYGDNTDAVDQQIDGMLAAG